MVSSVFQLFEIDAYFDRSHLPEMHLIFEKLIAYSKHNITEDNLFGESETPIFNRI